MLDSVSSRSAHRDNGRWDHHCIPRDSVDALLASWAARRPELDFSPVGVIARLGRVRSHIDAELSTLFAAYGLSAANFAVLVTLARIGGERGVSQRRLMDELGLTSGTISVRIDRLVEEGLVTRTPDPELKRNTLIALTDAGRELFERVVPAHLGNERRLLSALSAEEEEVLAALLRKLLVEFEGSLPPHAAPLRLGLVLAPAHEAITMRSSVGLPALPALLVRKAEEGGPAAGAGVTTGDLLTRAGRRELRSIASLYAAIDDAAKSRRLRLELWRGNESRHVTVRMTHAEPVERSLAATPGVTARGLHVV